MVRGNTNSGMDEEICRNLIDNALQGLAIIHDKKLIFANRTLAGITGYDYEELLSLPYDAFLSIIYPEDRDRILDVVLSGIARGKMPLRQEFRIIRKDGSLAWVDAMANFIDYQGKSAIQVAFLDITKRKLAEDKANASKELYRQILESISDGFFILDNDLFIGYFNPAAELLLGRKASEVLGHNLFEAFPEAKGSIFEEKYTLALKEKCSSSFETYFGVNPYDNWYDVRVYPRKNGISVFFQVITERKRAEEGQKISDERYRNLFETMSQGVVYQDKDGRIISANPAAERILGLTLDQMQGKTSLDPHWKAVHEDGSDFPGEDHPSMVALATGKEVKDVVMGIFNPKDSDYKWIRVNAVPQFRPGELIPYRVYTNFEDITGQKKVDDQLQTLIQRFHTILSSLCAGILLVTDDGLVEYANQAFCDFLNLVDAPDKLNGLTASEITEKVKNAYLHPDEEVARMNEIVDQGKPVKGEEIAMRDDRIGLRDFIPIQIDGKSYGRLWHHMDITELKRMEGTIRKSEEKYRSIVENSDDGISLTDESGNIIEWNRAQEFITGLKSDEVLGRPVWDVSFQMLPEEMRTQDTYEKTKSFMLRVLDKGRISLKGWFEEQEILCPDKTHKNLHVMMFPIRTEKGYRIGLISHDITERKQREDDLKIKEAAISSSINAFSMADPSGVLFYVNNSWLNMMGYARKEILKLSILDLMQDRKTGEEALGTLFEYGQCEGDIVLKRKDGSTFEADLSANIVRNNDGHPICMMFSFIDITTRREAERALQESENKLRAILNLLPIGVYVVDENKDIIDVNPAFERFMGLSKEELLRRKHWNRKYLRSDGSFLPSMSEDNYDQMHGGRPLDNGEPYLDLETGMEKEDGSIVWANTNAVPLPFSDWKVVVALEDITEKRQMQNELRDREERFRRIFELSPIGIQVFDMEGFLISANDASLKILKWKDSNKAKGYNIFRDALLDDEIQMTLQSGQIAHEGRWIKRKSIKSAKKESDASSREGKIYLDYIISPLGAKEKKPKGYLALIQDLTEMKLAEEALISDNERLKIVYDLWRMRVATGNMMAQNDREP
jgi:PAS domain S-box-containing protein